MKDPLSGQPSYKRIGLFDSGAGGLSVLAELAKTLPAAQFVYLADTARLPYGNCSRQEVETFVREIASFLSGFNLDLLVMTCTTTAALAREVAERVALEKINAETFEVLDLVQPVAGHIAARKFPALGVLSTSATARSQTFGKTLRALNFAGAVVEIGCPRLVPLIESGRLGEKEIEAALSFALKEYLSKLAGADAIVLGCSHYPFLRGRIEELIRGPLRAIFPAQVEIIDPGHFLVEQIRGRQAWGLIPDAVSSAGPDRCEMPPRAQDLEALILTGRAMVFATGDIYNFKNTAAHFLGRDPGLVRQISVNTLVQSERVRQVAMVTRSGSHPAVLLKPAMAPAGFFA